MDWPLHGLTMVGLARLDDLQRCVESVIRDGVEGDVIEAGTWRGGASLLLRATLNTLGERERTVWVADSFQGFPEAERDLSKGYDLDADLAGCDFLAIPLEEVRDNFSRFGLERGRDVRPGLLPGHVAGVAYRRWSIARLDGDTYEATRLSLEALYPGPRRGGYLIVDDYLSLDQCRKAVDDFRQRNGITEPIEPIDWSACPLARRTSPPRCRRGRRPGPARPGPTRARCSGRHEPVCPRSRRSR